MKAQHSLTGSQPDTYHSIKKNEPEPIFSEINRLQQDKATLLDTPFVPNMKQHAEWLSNNQSKSPSSYVLGLQRTYGNKYVQCLLSSKAIQAKLSVSQPGDPYEQEADRVADLINSQPLSEKRENTLQMQSEEEEEPIQAKVMMEEEEEELLQAKIMRQEDDEEELLQAKSISRGTEEEDTLRNIGRTTVSRLEISKLGEDDAVGGSSISEPLTNQILHSKGNGTAVPDTIQNKMQSHLGYDFNQVKVKTDTEAGNLCQQLGARAFTHGSDIWVGQGESTQDTKLMAHELTHVAQQGAAPKVVAMETDLLNREQNELQRLPAEGIIQADDDDEAVATPNFPSISSITGDSRVKQARNEDWQAGKSDFFERFGWITWDSKTKKCAVTGRKKGDEFGVVPDAAPTDAHPVYMVGHYHTHPPLSPTMITEQKEFRKTNGKEMFPIGPSSADKGFANGNNSPGVVEDFITALRWPPFLTWDFKYGPNKRT